MDWFGWHPPKDMEQKQAAFGPKTLLQDLDKRVARYLDDVDHGRLVYPACKRARGEPRSKRQAILTSWLAESV